MGLGKQAGLALRLKKGMDCPLSLLEFPALFRRTGGHPGRFTGERAALARYLLDGVERALLRGVERGVVRREDIALLSWLGGHAPLPVGPTEPREWAS
jgi:hypothetical protein